MMNKLIHTLLFAMKFAPWKKILTAIMKPAKSLFSSHGECAQSNPLTGFSGQMAAGVQKSQAMNRLASRSSSSSQQQHPLAPAPLSLGEMSGIYESHQGGWADQFGSTMMQPHQMSHFSPTVGHGPFHPGPMFHPMMMGGQMMGPRIVHVPPSQVSTPSGPIVDDLDAARKMVEMLRSSGNPKFADSTFVNFMERVVDKQLSFKEGQVVDHTGNPVSWESVYEETDTWKDDIYADAGDDAENFPDQLDQIWNELKQSTLPQQPNYSFQHTHNKYIDDSRNLLELALELMDAGRDGEAVEVLEAEVRVNPNSSEGWRLLGQLHAQFDRDSDAIKCYEQGHAVDGFNQDLLMALGVSLTNEHDSIRAMGILNQWISASEKFHDLANSEEVQGNPLDQYDYSRIRDKTIGLFNQAFARDPTDANVCIALGVLHNINRDFPMAIEYFLRATEINPTDFTAWNKLGATLANAGLSREALPVYHHALSLKPNYGRAWNNLGIAHANLEEYEISAKFFLTAIQLGGDSWSALFMALSNWAPDRVEFGDLVETKNITGLIAAIPGVPRIDQLPPKSQIDPSETMGLIEKIRTSLGLIR